MALMLSTGVRGRTRSKVAAQAPSPAPRSRRRSAEQDPGLVVVEPESLSKRDVAHLARYFRERVFPVLTPLALDPGHPFLLAADASLNLAVIVRHPRTGEEYLACVEIPSLLPRFVALRDGERHLPVEGVVATNLRALFPGMEIVDHGVFRLTYEGAGAAPRRAQAVRLEVGPGMPDDMRELLVRHVRFAPGEAGAVRLGA